MKAIAVAFLGVVVALLNISSGNALKRKYEDRFLDYGIYTIMNRAFDKQYLTFILTPKNASDPTSVDVVVPPELRFGGVDGQKWRLDQAALYTAFELRPTVNENYVLEYRSPGVLQWIAGWGKKLWYIQDAGDNFSFVKHRRFKVCLQATENKPVTAKECDGSIFQQWKFIIGKESK